MFYCIIANRRQPNLYIYGIYQGVYYRREWSKPDIGGCREIHRRIGGFCVHCGPGVDTMAPRNSALMAMNIAKKNILIKRKVFETIKSANR